MKNGGLRAAGAAEMSLSPYNWLYAFARPVVKSAMSLGSRMYDVERQDPGPIFLETFDTVSPGALVPGGGSLGTFGGKAFSPLREAVEKMPMKKGSGPQFEGYLKKQPGVKPEEMDATGMSEWLQSQKGLTKEEALKFIDENQVQMNETWKGVQEPISPEAMSAKPPFMSESEWTRRLAGPPEPTKYDKWQLPGGENYRELLMRMKIKKSEELAALEKKADEVAALRGDAHKKLWAEVNSGKLRDTSEIQRRNKEIDKFDDELEKIESQKSLLAHKDYRSSHWDEPNVLAHTRMNDRVTADGKNSLHIEEIQSDWHQAGRKQGYQGQRGPERPMVGIMKDGYWEVQTADGQFVTNVQDPNLNEVQAIQEARRRVQQEPERTRVGVPDAPFKKSWGELALKRMVKQAVDEGKDSITWTPGAEQAKRYDLSKHVDSVDYFTKNGETIVNVYKDNKNVAQKTIKNDQELEAFIGKEVAEKIRSGVGKTNESNGIIAGTIDNQNLVIGGEGMKGFYDDMLVKSANKLFKKYGGKVRTTKISTHDAAARSDWIKNFGDKDLAPEFDKEVWELPITDKMREEYGSKGFSMFSKGAGQAPRDEFEGNMEELLSILGDRS